MIPIHKTIKTYRSDIRLPASVVDLFLQHGIRNAQCPGCDIPGRNIFTFLGVILIKSFYKVTSHRFRCVLTPCISIVHTVCVGPGLSSIHCSCEFSLRNRGAAIFHIRYRHRYLLVHDRFVCHCHRSCLGSLNISVINCCCFRRDRDKRPDSSPNRDLDLIS